MPLITQGIDFLRTHMRIARLQIFKSGDLFIHLLPHGGASALLQRLELRLSKLLRLAQHGVQQCDACFGVARQQPRAGHGRERHGRHGLGVVGQVVLFVGVGPGPVEHVLAVGVVFQVKRACGVQLPAPPQRCGQEAGVGRDRVKGQRAGVLYNQENWQKAFVKTYGEMDIVIDSACGNGFAALIDVLAFGGRIAFYGGGQGAINGLNPQKIFWKQVSILGSTMGSDQQFVEMVDFVEKHHIKPVIDGIYALEDGQAAFKHMAQGAQFGKIVVRVA